MGTASEDTTDVARLELESQIIQRRRQGLSFDMIAKELGYANRSGPWKIYQAVVARMRIEVNESADELRWMIHQRGEAVLRGGLWQRAQKGEHAAIQDWLAIERQTREMYGIDAPKTNVLSGPGGAPLMGSPTAADAARLVREMFGDHAAKSPETEIEDGLHDEPAEHSEPGTALELPDAAEDPGGVAGASEIPPVPPSE